MSSAPAPCPPGRTSCNSKGKTLASNRLHVRAFNARNPGLDGLRKVFKRVLRGDPVNDKSLSKYLITPQVQAKILAGTLKATEYYRANKPALIETLGATPQVAQPDEILTGAHAAQEPVPPVDRSFTYAAGVHVINGARERKTRELIKNSTRVNYLNTWRSLIKALGLFRSEDDNELDLLPAIKDFHGVHHTVMKVGLERGIKLSSMFAQIKLPATIIRESPRLKQLLSGSDAPRLYSRFVTQATGVIARQTFEANRLKRSKEWNDVLQRERLFPADSVERTLFLTETELTRRYIFNTCLIVPSSAETADDTKNYFIRDTGTVQLNDYKTVGARSDPTLGITFGKRWEHTFSAPVRRQIAKSLKKHPRQFLIQRDADAEKGKQTSEESLAQMFDDVFGMKVQELRRARVTRFHADNPETSRRAKLANSMGHSLDMAMRTYSAQGEDAPQTEDALQAAEDHSINMAVTRSQTRAPAGTHTAAPRSSKRRKGERRG